MIKPVLTSIVLGLAAISTSAHADECDTYIAQIVVASNATVEGRKGDMVDFKAGPYALKFNCQKKVVSATIASKYPKVEFFQLVGAIGRVVTKKPVDDVGAAAMMCRDNAYTDSGHVGLFEVPGISITCVSEANEFVAIVTPKKG